jgi:hypothetical protein
MPVEHNQIAVTVSTVNANNIVTKRSEPDAALIQTLVVVAAVMVIVRVTFYPHLPSMTTRLKTNHNINDVNKVGLYPYLQMKALVLGANHNNHHLNTHTPQELRLRHHDMHTQNHIIC